MINAFTASGAHQSRTLQNFISLKYFRNKVISNTVFLLRSNSAFMKVRKRLIDSLDNELIRWLFRATRSVENNQSIASWNVAVSLTERSRFVSRTESLSLITVKCIVTKIERFSRHFLDTFARIAQAQRSVNVMGMVMDFRAVRPSRVASHAFPARTSSFTYSPYTYLSNDSWIFKKIIRPLVGIF